MSDGIAVHPGAIKAARLKKWWTQEDLAEASGVSVPTIYRLERPAGEPIGVRMGTARKLCTALEIAPEELASPMAAPAGGAE